MFYKCDKCQELLVIPIPQSDTEQQLRDRVRDMNTQLKYYQDLNLDLIEKKIIAQRDHDKLKAFLERIKEVAFIAEELKANPVLGIPELPAVPVALGVNGITPPPIWVQEEKPVVPVGSATEIGSDSHQDMLADRLSRQKYKE
jgi:hypothetical protein